MKLNTYNTRLRHIFPNLVLQCQVLHPSLYSTSISTLNENMLALQRLYNPPCVNDLLRPYWCVLIFFLVYFATDMRDKLRKWRDENYRNSEQIVDVGEELINEHSSKLGDDSKYSHKVSKGVPLSCLHNFHCRLVFKMCLTRWASQYESRQSKARVFQGLSLRLQYLVGNGRYGYECNVANSWTTAKAINPLKTALVCGFAIVCCYQRLMWSCHDFWGSSALKC